MAELHMITEKKSFHEYENLEHMNSYNKAQFQESKKRGRPKMNA
jgi:hypothetical protein